MAKAAVWDAVWKPWGEADSINGSVALDARFPGQWFQIEAGLHYNWHRHYDPSIGRYTQPDPLGFVDGPSVYGYVQAKSQQLVDPQGLAGKGPTIIPFPNRPGPPISQPGNSFSKWIKQKIQQCVDYFTPRNKDPCEEEQVMLLEIIDQYTQNYSKSDPVTQLYLSQEQKPIINQRILEHNNRCPNNKVNYL